MPERREFIKLSTGLAVALSSSCATSQAATQGAVGGPVVGRAAGSASTGTIARRPLGATGLSVSILGIGGSHLGDVKTEQEAMQIVHEAIDSGINFFDNAWEYHDGMSESRMGKALKGKRDKVVLMTKVCTHGRDENVAMKQLDESLTRLGTDHLDVWQIHECVYDDDPERHFAPHGVVAAMDKAKQQGKVRFVGFTGHKHPGIHLKMLSHGYPFSTCQMPLNCFDSSFRSFEKQVLPEAAQKKVAVIGMKSLGGTGEAIKKGAVTIEEALRYAMSLPVATTVSGIDSLSVLRQNLAIARGFTPMTVKEMDALRARTESAASDGRFELYKTTMHFDGKEGREQHDFPSQKELPL